MDVGCGDGRFIRHAKEHGFEVWGLDFDRKSVENVKRSLGIDTVFAMSLEEFYDYAKKNDLKFDVITFFEVLEHQDKPREFLQMVRDLLKDGGYIAGSVPNRESMFLFEITQKGCWIDWPPHHFLRFSESSLEKALTLCGFRYVEVYRLDFPFKELLPYLEKKIFGNIDGIKRKLKAKVLGNERKALAYAVEDLSSAGANKGVALFLLILKYLRNLLLLPFALMYVGKRKGNSLYMYFQAKLK
ncbi:Methyltransferase type 12 [Thermodesulfovibrio sp. N1]|nr:Methyltransferase type 12 [Thermodesulfovibrio sp. N1]